MPSLLLSALVLAAPADAPDPKSDALARYGAAKLQQSRGELPAAAKQFEAAAKADPTAAAPSRELVKLYLELGRDAAASRAAKQVLAADPADADTAHALARMQFAAKRHADAASTLRIGLASPRLEDRPTKALAMWKDAVRCAEELRDDAGAERVTTAALRFLATAYEKLRRDGFKPAELDAEIADMQERRGKCLLRQKKFAEAEHAFGVAALKSPAAAARVAWHRATALNAAGDTNAALRELDKILALKPKSPEPYERFAEWTAAAGRPRDVLPRLDALLAADPDNLPLRWVTSSVRLWGDYATGDAAFKELCGRDTGPGFFPAALRGYVAVNRADGFLDLCDVVFTAARPDPDADPKPDGDRSAAGDRARDLGEAVANAGPQLGPLLKQASREAAFKSRRPETVEMLAWAADRAGKQEDAEQLLRTAFDGPVGQKPAVPLALLNLYERQRQWDEVIQTCDRGLRGQKAYYFYYFRKADALAEQGNGPAALAQCGRAADGAKFLSRRAKARVLSILGDYRKMLAECRAMLDEFKDPGEIRATQYLLSEAHLGLKEYDRSEAVLREILEEDPDDALALNNLGYNLADQGRKLAEAEALIRLALDLDRDERARSGVAELENPAYLDSLGWVLFRRGEYKQARESLERAVAAPDGAYDPTAWDHLGDVYYRVGDRPAAKKAWQKAAQLYEGSHTGRQNGRRDETLRKLKLGE